MIKEQQSNITNEILTDNLIQLMFKLSIPGILGMVFVGLNTFVDALLAGQLIGQTALAGISLSLPLTSIVTGCAVSVGIGSASVLSRAIGSKDITTQTKIFCNMIIISLVVSLLITIIGYSFCDELISLMGGKNEVAVYGTTYLRIYILGSICFVPAVASNQLIKAQGKIKLATSFSIIFVSTNILLDILFVNILNWGIEGIAFATNIAALVHAIVNFTYFFSQKSSIPIIPKKLKISLELLPAILSVGSSVMLMQIMSTVQQIVIFKSVANYGTDSDIAFAGATVRLYSLLITPLYGLVQALQPVIGMNYGAQNYKRLKNAYLTFGIAGTCFLFLLWLPIQLFPKIFLRWLIPDFNFTNNDLLNFHIITLLLPSVSFVLCSVAFFQSIGNGKIAGLITILKQVIIFLPILLIFPIFFGVNGIYYGTAVVDAFTFILVSFLTLIEFRRVYIKISLNKDITV